MQSQTSTQTQTSTQLQAPTSTFRSVQPPSTLVNYSLSDESFLDEMNINPSHESPIASAQIRQSTPNNQGQTVENNPTQNESLSLIEDFDEPSSKRARISNAPLNVTFTFGPTSTPSIQADFTTEYKLILEEFIKSADQQFACPSTLTREQRAEKTRYCSHNNEEITRL